MNQRPLGARERELGPRLHRYQLGLPSAGKYVHSVRTTDGFARPATGARHAIPRSSTGTAACMRVVARRACRPNDEVYPAPPFTFVATPANRGQPCRRRSPHLVDSSWDTLGSWTRVALDCAIWHRSRFRNNGEHGKQRNPGAPACESFRSIFFGHPVRHGAASMRLRRIRNTTPSSSSRMRRKIRSARPGTGQGGAAPSAIPPCSVFHTANKIINHRAAAA